MRKHWKPLAAAAALGTLICVAVFRPSEKEPRYNGRSLSTWLALYDGVKTVEDGHYYQEGDQAVHAIGTNALPFLVQWIRHEPPFWLDAARTVIPQAISDTRLVRPLIYGPGNERRRNALHGFRILGTNAAPAIPALVALMLDTNRSTTARSAIMALSMIGAPAVPSMLAGLSDTNYTYRRTIATLLVSFTVPEAGTNAVLPGLIAALNDPNPEVRGAVTNAILRLAPGALTNSPAH